LSLPEPVEAYEPGVRFHAEIREQPEALRRLLEHDAEFARVADAIRERGPLVRIVGHGSSDNAATYGVYAFGVLAGRTALRDSIALTVYFDAAFDLTGSTVLGLSQSGQTPDVVEYLVRARRRGAFTVAVTNDPASELAQVAEAVLPLEAGPELAVAATKTYLNQLAALALLAAHVGENGKRVTDGVKSVSDQLEQALPALEVQAQALALPFAYVGRMFVIGRGPEFATARETALKLLETCRLAASPLTATDLVHGPVAVLDPLFPVWTIASRDRTLAAVQEASQHVRKFGSTIVVCGNAADAIEGAEYRLPVPSPGVQLLSPLLSVVPGQLFAAALARGKGFDPDRPRGLTKVTLAQ
jgi:glucosamine--fructose-6-phosphate aminotransferase (isomerizing)